MYFRGLFFLYVLNVPVWADFVHTDLIEHSVCVFLVSVHFCMCFEHEENVYALVLEGVLERSL